MCLRAAASDVDEEKGMSRPIEPDPAHEQILASKHDVQIAFMQRREAWPATNEYIEQLADQRKRSDKRALYGCALFIFLAVFGIIAIAQWL